MSAKILIAADDPVQRRLLASLCNRFGYEVETVASGQGARRVGPERGANRPLISIRHADLDGMAVLRPGMGAKLPLSF
jgi:DNA-binding NtrC family response regulator